jgi:lipopolysaccharide/colanic/teichoic acid biosynthesis glycosyltransferase
MELVIVHRPRVLPRRRTYRLAKKAFDLGLTLLTLPFVSIVMLLCAVAIALDSSGPILFVQDRVGKGGRHFKLYKFRTMHHNLDTSSHRAFMKAFVNGSVNGSGVNGSHGAKSVYKPFSEQHVTRVGRILRKTSLDELPQLINVIRGEMSLVGPRPNVLWEVEEYMGWHKERLEVLPGITGLAQINGRSANTFDQIVRYDIEYVENRSFKLDLRILWWTVLSVLRGKGAL